MGGTGDVPQGNSRCSSPPAAMNSHSASLGRNPPSQVQKAYASYQFTQFTGRSSFPPAADVHVDPPRSSQVRLVSVGAICPSSEATQPGSKETPPSSRALANP